MTDRVDFFDRARSDLFSPAMSAAQVAACTALLSQCEAQGVTDPRQQAYVLATPFGEVGPAMVPIDEIGRGAGMAYGVPAGPYGLIYYGRGFSQLTWLSNYEWASTVTGIDLVRYPQRANEVLLAAQLQVAGMKSGHFTGAKLSDYFNATRCDFLNARRIINWIDRAAEFEGYARRFWYCLGGPAYLTVLKRGTVGSNVRRLQNALKLLGFYAGAVDGDFGPATERAVMAFQRAKGLDVDGEVGPATAGSLSI